MWGVFDWGLCAVGGGVSVWLDCCVLCHQGLYHLPQEKDVSQGTLGCQGDGSLEVHQDHEGVHQGVRVVGDQEDWARPGHVLDPLHLDPPEEYTHRDT